MTPVTATTGLAAIEHTARNILQLHQSALRLLGSILEPLEDSAASLPSAFAAHVAECRRLMGRHETESRQASEKISRQVKEVIQIMQGTSPTRELRVVVIEDEPLIRADLTAMVRSFGHNVVAEGGSAAELHATTERERPDVVVFDVHLPDGDGLVAFRGAVAGGLDTAGVAVTGDRGTDTELRAIENDLFAFVLKPVNPEQLRATIRLAHARSQQMAALRTENTALSRAVDDRTGAVERAKAKLARNPGLQDGPAFRFIREIARRYNVTHPQAAEMVLRDEVTYGLHFSPPGHRVPPVDLDTGKTVPLSDRLRPE